MKNRFSLSPAAFLLLMASKGALAQAPTCNQAPTPDCLYLPGTRYAYTEVERSTTYFDIAGLSRTVNVLLRIPTGAPLPMPVVIWSHGGAEGKENPHHSLAEWSEVTAEAGYLTVSIAHTPRVDLGNRYALCAAPPLLMDATTCDGFKYLHWDRPHDIAAVIDELDQLNASGPYAGYIDIERIAVGGHSSGSSGGLSVAGALRDFSSIDYTGTVLDLHDPRPVAFLAFSPQGPGAEGFFDTDFKKDRHSWGEIWRPVLIGTGDGDNTCDRLEEPGSCFGDSPYIRRIAFGRMPGNGNKYHIYLNDAETFHTLFELKTSECSPQEKDVSRAKCDEMARWLSATALAFLDAHVRQDPNAQQWLNSDNIVAASRGVAEWLRK